MKNSLRQRWFCWWQRLPILGSLLFLLLYVTATFFYPGGNLWDKSARGFQWTQNFWCNLLSDEAINGQPNPAKPVAFAAMGVVSLTLLLFWYRFPDRVGLKTRERLIVQVSGALSMLIGVFVFTDFHDRVINVAGFFGMIALTGTLFGLYRAGWRQLFYLGLLLVFLIGLNNLLYYGKNLLVYLPIVQKITFLFFLIWISLVNLRWCRESVANTGLVEES